MQAAHTPRSRRFVGAEVALLVLLVGLLAGWWFGSVASSVDDGAPGVVAMQTDDRGRTNPVAVRTDGDVPTVSATIDPSARAQTWIGVGGALTDAAATLLSATPAGVDALFGSTEQGGAGLDLVRLPLSATDFSTTDWTWSLDPSGDVMPPPPALAALDVLDSVSESRPDVGVIAASWTSPPEMRSDGAARGGALLDSSVDDYAALLAGQAAWLRERGVPLMAMSLGNEPGHLGDYPTLTITDDQILELADRVGPQLDELGVDLLALDHNWEDAERAAGLVARGEFDVVGFHCYGGSSDDVAAITAPHLVTECTATGGGWHTSVGWMARELVGRAVAAGSTGLVMWNLALDPNHGPKSPGGCVDCRGLVTVDTATGEVTPTPEFHVLRQLSAAADPGAAVLRTAPIESLPIAAFANPDGTIGVFGHNDTAAAVELELDIGGAGAFTLRIDPWSVFSVRTGAS